MRTWFTRFKVVRRYPSLVVGIALVLTMVVISIYAVISIPYSEAVRLWRASPGVWDENPRNANPVYFDWFSRDRLPRTIVVTLEEAGTMTEEPIGDGMKRVEIVLPFNYDYDGFPRELSLFTYATYEGPRPFISVYWRMPDGEVITISEEVRVSASHRYHISQDAEVRRALGGVAPHVGLFAVDPLADVKEPWRGGYELLVEAELREGEDLDHKLVVYGQVEGLAGTDHRRRDLMVALLWGAPIGLIFGVLAAVGAQVSTFVLGAIGTWFGGKVDALFQRLTELTMVLPMLAILIVVGHFYTRSIWVMLGLVIALSVFSASMKVYRAMFLQAKESAYLEAAQSYGASNTRIIFRYLIPRLIPVLLPQFVLVIPTFVFLEASLAVLGLGDPLLPTWGKVIFDARVNDALYKGYYYWMVQPAVLLMATGFGFALAGYTLDRIFNPRLRQI